MREMREMRGQRDKEINKTQHSALSTQHSALLTPNAQNPHLFQNDEQEGTET
jgi:hypothetical protein